MILLIVENFFIYIMINEYLIFHKIIFTATGKVNKLIILIING